jgi:tetratricopeptide (TPR) repeat protein
VEQIRLLQIFVSLCQTVGYAHSRGVLHRDLKPENVMLGPYGETILLDWGIAKVIGQPETPAGQAPAQTVTLFDADDEDTQTRVGAIMGTPSYMAPEVAMGKNEEVDQRSDVYLLGATLYEILTGRQPRRARTAMEMIKLAQKEPPPPASKVNPRVPRALDAICRKAMAHAKGDRYPSALELADDVQRFVAGEPVSAFREGLAARAWRWARRHRKALARAAAALAIVGLVAASAVVVQNAERARLLAQREADQLKKRDQARREVARFRRLADEARFLAATTDPVFEHAPYFDPQEAENTARAALTLASQWGPALGGLLDPEERERIKPDLYDLILLTAQLRSQRPRAVSAEPVAMVFLLAAGTKPEATPARATLALLDEAARLHQPSRGFYRLRAQVYRQLGDDARAAEDETRAGDLEQPATYLDHYLLAETLRNEAAGRDDPKEERKIWQPDPERMEKAIDEYHHALRLAPSHYWSHYQLGRCYLSLGRFEEAVEVLTTCIALRPDASWGYSARSLALVQLKQANEAEQDLDRAIQLSPDSRAARLNRGAVYLAQGKNEKALADLDAVLAPPVEQQIVEAAYYRGLVHANLGEVTKALNDFDRVVREIPGYRQVYLDRARILISRAENEKALADLDRYRGLLDGEPAAMPEWERHARRGRLLRLMYADLPIEKRGGSKAAQGLLTLGLSELLTAVRMQGRVAQLFDDTGALFELAGRLPDALEAYSVGLQLEPKHVRLRIKRGWAFLQARRPKDALADFEAAADADPENAEAHSGLGYVRALGKLRPGAQHEAELALVQGVDNYLVLHNVACIYAELSNTDDREANQEVAVALLRRALNLWKQADKGPSELELMKTEPAFQPLRDRKDFQELLEGRR